MPKEKLKIGLLIKRYQMANWQFKVIEELKKSVFAEISLVIINNAPDKNSISGFPG